MLGHQPGDDRSDAIDEHIDAMRVGVEAVRLIEIGLHRNTFQEKWIERRLMGVRQIGEDPIEGAVIGFSPVRRRAHAEKQHFGTVRVDLLDHFVEIVAHCRRIDAAQRIVGAQGQDD